MKISILGFGAKGIARTLAYESVSRYYPSCPIKPVLYQAFALSADADKAKASGWQVVTDLDAVIQDPEAEYVDVCLPYSLRPGAVIEALKAGKHVFCEAPFPVSHHYHERSPFASYFNEARQMADAAEAKPELLNSVNFVYRRCPANVYARKLIKENTFGKLLEARLYYSKRGNIPQTPFYYPINVEEQSYELYSHALDMLYFTTGMRPIELVAFQKSYFTRDFDLDIQDSNCTEGRFQRTRLDRPWFQYLDPLTANRVMYTLPNGAIGSLECTRLAWGSENAIGYELYFENGAIRWCYNDVNYLNVYDATAPERGWNRVLTNRVGFGYPSFADGHMYGYRDFLVNACYENMLKISGEPETAPIATFQDAYETSRIIKAIQASCENLAWVKLSDFQ